MENGASLAWPADAIVAETAIAITSIVLQADSHPVGNFNPVSNFYFMKHLARISFLIAWFAGCSVLHAQQDPLPSWRNDSLKQAILHFVQQAAQPGAPGYIPPADRIATFDNDGTLWCEKPLVEGLFMIFRAKRMIEKNPALKQKEPYKSIAAGNLSFLKTMDEKAMISLFLATHSNLTAGEFMEEARLFFEKATTPAGKSIASVVYKPQVELLRYLRANGFKTFICSGGDVDFMRAISEKYYGIPPEQVIGTSSKYQYRDSAGINDLYRTTTLAVFNDKQQKPASIQTYIGKRPVFACGNEGGGGDIYMLRFSQGGSYPSFQLLVDHDDAAREAGYEEKDNKSLDWARKYGWHVISMKNNWTAVFEP